MRPATACFTRTNQRLVEGHNMGGRFQDLQPFQGPRLLLDRAADDLGTFSQLCELYVRATPLTTEASDLPGGGQLVYFKFHEPLPHDARLLAYRLCSDLRHILDQALVHADRVASGERTKKKLYFPVVKGDDHLRRHTASKNAGLNSRVAAELPNVAVIATRSPVPHAVLSAANEKHNDLLPLSVAHTGLTSGKLQLRMHGPAQVDVNRWDDTAQRLEFARVFPGGRIDVGGRPDFQVRLLDGQNPLDVSAASAIQQTLDLATSIVRELENQARS
jgi:hypothetical protein